MSEPLPELFAGLPPVAPKPVLKVVCTRANYLESVKARWHGWALIDARENWSDFEELKETFRAWCDHYRRDSRLCVGEKAHNPEGTLTSMVYVMQTALQPDKACLHPCLDFDNHFQTVFIRRGLLMYLTLLLKEMEP